MEEDLEKSLPPLQIFKSRSEGALWASDGTPARMSAL